MLQVVAIFCLENNKILFENDQFIYLDIMVSDVDYILAAYTIKMASLSFLSLEAYFDYDICWLSGNCQ